MGVSQFCVVVGMNDVPGHFGYCFFLNLKVSGTHIITSNLIYFYSIPRDLHPQRDAYKLDALRSNLRKTSRKPASFIEAGCRLEFGILLPSL
jgi:hypothetical protein